MCTCTHTHACAHRQMCVHACTHACTCTHRQRHACTHTHRNRHAHMTHTHTHTKSWLGKGSGSWQMIFDVSEVLLVKAWSFWVATRCSRHVDSWCFEGMSVTWWLCVRTLKPWILKAWQVLEVLLGWGFSLGRFRHKAVLSSRFVCVQSHNASYVGAFTVCIQSCNTRFSCAFIVCVCVCVCVCVLGGQGPPHNTRFGAVMTRCKIRSSWVWNCTSW